MKVNKDNLELAKSETVAEIPLACSNELAAVEFLEKRLWKGEPEVFAIANPKMFTP